MSYKDEQYQGVDTSARISAYAAKVLVDQFKISFCGRYLGGNYGTSIQEITDIQSAGLSILFFYERGAGDIKQGAVKGKIQGKDAYNCAKQLGIPEGTCIYFVCDQSTVKKSEFDAIEAYLKAAKAEISTYRCGIYGSYYVIEEMHTRNACDCFCQCSAWSQNKISSHLDVYQYEGETGTRAKLIARGTGFNVDLEYCPNFNRAGLWVSTAKPKSSNSVTLPTVYNSSPYKPNARKVFVPRTVAPLATERWWRKPENPCINIMNGTVLPNCFVGGTNFITNHGVISLSAGYKLTRSGSSLDVPTSDGEWHPAVVKYFGVQKIYKVVLEHSTYYCTANHRWLISTRRGLKAVPTIELKSFMKIPYRMCNTQKWARVVEISDTGRSEGVYCVVEPVTRSFTLEGGEITGNCVGYAHGRFCEILGYFHPDLPTCHGGQWLDNIKSKKTSLKWGKEPKLGAVAVWKREGSYGHVAVVECINSDGTVIFSESGYGASWKRRFWNSGRKSAPNWYGSSYTFQGFIYNPGTEDITSVVPYSGGVPYGTDISEDSPMYSTSTVGVTTLPVTVGVSYAQATDHPARQLLRTMMSHIGKDAHQWVIETTGIQKNQGWSTATCCAAAIDAGYTDVLFPRDKFVCAEFARRMVEDYNGLFIEGGARGGTTSPQIGDVFGIYASNQTPSTKYAATRIGLVRGIEDKTILTIEGDLQDSILLNKRRMQDVSWYIRPDWTIVGGSINVTSLFDSPLYATESTREDATLREVGYFDDKTFEPSINMSDAKLSAINYTKLLSSLYDAAGYSNIVSLNNNFDNSGLSTSLNYTVDCSKLEQNGQVIFNYFMSQGFSPAIACGWIANAYAESSFKPDAINSKGAIGLFQYQGDRKLKMIQMCPDWRTNLLGQCEFVMYELGTSETTTANALKTVTGNDITSAKKATELICQHYERSGSYVDNFMKRNKICQDFWDKLIITNSNGNIYNPVQSGMLTTRSGARIDQGRTIEIPSWVGQTGIIADYTSYTIFYSKWSRTSKQRILADIWNSQGRPGMYSIATINGYFLVAVTTKFGYEGEIIAVVLEDGTYIMCIIGDSKGRSPKNKYGTSEWGHLMNKTQADIIEWEATSESQPPLKAGLKQAGWYGKKIVKIVNFGTWLD